MSIHKYIIIVESKSSKTNQGPHLVLIYYKLIFFKREIFRRKRKSSDGRQSRQTEDNISDARSRRSLSSENTIREC